MEHSKFQTKLRITQFTWLVDFRTFSNSFFSSCENSFHCIMFMLSTKASNGELYSFSTWKSQFL